jgi:hypothetical protein
MWMRVGRRAVIPSAARPLKKTLAPIAAAT